MKKNNGISSGNERMRISSSILFYLILFVGFVISLIWLCQIGLLDNVYRSYTISKINKSAKAISDNIENEDLELLADRLCAENDVTITLLNEHFEKIINADHTRFSVIQVMSHSELESICSMTNDDGTPLLNYSIVQPFRNEQYNPLRYIGSVPTNDVTTGTGLVYVQKLHRESTGPCYLMLSALITPFNNTLNILQHQLFFITSIVTMVAVVIAVLISNRVAMPIVETSKAARLLSSGKFRRPEHIAYKEIDELNDILEQVSVDLNKVEKLQTELIANISHDLRTPLTMIEGYAEVMRDIPGENTPENVQIIIDETNRLSSLVGEVLDFSRWQSGSMKLQKADFDLCELIRDISGRISRMIEKDGYQILFQYDEPLIVNADKSAISQVIYNLIGNALTYTGEDKIVSVSLGWVDGLAHVEIHDTGKGIPEEELKLIWKRYYRSGNNHRRAVVGTGLGLSIVQCILEAHNVSYDVVSVLNQGTTFWFDLPAVK